jgi:hypothetical protein
MSCILRLDTQQGRLYFKACPPTWPQEPALTCELSLHYPQLIPHVAAIEARERWLLTEAFEGPKLRQIGNRDRYIPLWEQLIEDFGRMQLDYVDRRPQLTSLGCPDWPLVRLAASIDRFLLQEVPFLAGEGDAIPLQQLEEAAARLTALCAELMSFRIPDTLHHGDFHSGNILTDGRSCRVVDWAFQSGVAHPFFFLAVVFEEHTDPAIRARLCDLYLRLWTDYEPMHRLRKAVELAQPLALLHEAMGHYRQLQSARTPWEVAQERAALAHYVRCLVSSDEVSRA